MKENPPSSPAPAAVSGLALRARAAQGADVLLNGFGDADQIEATRAGLEQEYGVRVRYSPADMRQPGQVREMAKFAAAEFGKVDVIVNNAGIQHVAPTEEMPDDKWDAIVAINLSSAFHLIKAVLPGMKARLWGRIINIASAHGLVASPFKAPIAPALVALTPSIASRPSSSRRSSTPQAKAPWAPPPCNASVIGFTAWPVSPASRIPGSVDMARPQCWVQPPGNHLYRLRRDRGICEQLRGADRTPRRRRDRGEERDFPLVEE